MAIHISKMTGKLETFKAINSNTLTNSFCQKMSTSKRKNIICTECYSVSMLEGFRRNTVPALERNTVLSERPITETEIEQIKKDLSRETHVRIHGHGEIINWQHAVNLLVIVERNPRIMFAWWTKRKDIINKLFTRTGKPKNLIMIYSNPFVNKVLDNPPNWFNKTFNNVSSHPDENCTGQKCKDCMVCYTINDTKTIIEKVK